jgi:N-methylhydantoinase B/oxoprolinase/acetone carboxylase alpha subunit
MMDLDGISLELMRSRLQSVVDEAGATLVRTAHAHIIREVKDFAIALADARGRPVVSTQTIPVFLGTIPTTIKRFLEHFPLDSMGPAT